MADSLEKLVGPYPKIEKVVEGMWATEGPAFSRAGFLLFSDIPARRIMKWDGGAATAFRADSNRANGLTFDHLGRLLACEAGCVTRTEHDGLITVLADQFEGKGLNLPNDLVCAIDGSIYFSDLLFRNPLPNPARTDFSALYQITPRGKVRVVSRDCARPNGIALTANQQKLYLADSGPRTIWVYEVAPDGTLKNGHLFADMSSDKSGVPDGLKTDEQGNVWVAGPGGIWVFNARGERLGIIKLPENPTNCCWGGNFRDLFVTCGACVYRISTQVNGTRTY
ncbi:MAG TPA: SMP-30/gluconolactonase/LRE family protein [Terriglobia bacterium]|nr:SMP-30/gluconolactonase/LRE family protein [Terriglobia bacterium]